MGCSDSRAVETRSDSKPPTNKSSKSAPPKASDSTTVKDFFDAALVLPEQHGEPYTQPVIPDFYVEQNLEFENENVDNGIWDTKINLSKKAKANSSKQVKESEIAWHYKKPGNQKYVEPDDSLTVDIEYEQNAKKKQVVVIGGLYLGCKAACAENIFERIDVESTHTLVLLGNLFDMLSIDSFHQTPTDISKIESILASAEPVLLTLKGLASQVNVYYMLGSHDTDLTRVAIQRLLGDELNYISQTNLILNVKSGNENYRVRLTSGRQWDFMNDRKLTSGNLLAGKPIGHYLARAAADNTQFSVSALIKPMVSAIPADLDQDFLQQISRRPLQNRITERMLLCAFQLSKPEDLVAIKCLIDEGKYISAQPIIEYPYIKYLIEQYGKSSLMSMFKAMGGDYSGVAKDCGEDVMISGLGDEATLSKVRTKSGHDIICASTGSCSRRSATMTMLNIVFPKQGCHGKIEIVTCHTESKPQQNGTKKIEAVTEDKMDTLSVESL